MKNKVKLDVIEAIKNSNINFLFGAGVADPFLPLLGDIENRINKAIDRGDENAQAKAYKEYFTKIMLPNKRAIVGSFQDETEECEYERVIKTYRVFLDNMVRSISKRGTTTLRKQINIFTTNIDILFETALESLRIEYNDGFYGRLNPVFDSSNFKKSIFQGSLHSDHKSEIPVVNLFKIHGSLTWKNDKDRKNILFSKDLEHLEDDLMEKEGAAFIKGYEEKVLVVNPGKDKLSKTVLNEPYNELLRSYALELERENSILFIIGFSMRDEHIKKITFRAAKSNPTLKIFILASDATAKKIEEDKKDRSTIYHNIGHIIPTNAKETTLGMFSELLYGD